MFVFEVLDVFAEKMWTVEGCDSAPVKLAYFELVWEGILSLCATLEEMAGVLAGRRDLKPVVIAREAREGLKHFVRDRLCLVDDHSHLGAGLVEWVTTFGFAGVICDEAFDLASGVITSNQKLNDLKDLATIRDIDLFADVLYVLIRLIFKLLVRR